MEEPDFERLCLEHWQPVLGYALRRTSTAADAADVVAEVFTVAWRRRAEVPGEAGARPWLFGVARNVIANQRRGLVRRSRLQARLLEAVAVDAPDTADVADDHFEGRRVTQALASLPEADRELLTLIGWEGLTPSQAAVALGINSTTARVRLHRARRRLREALAATEKRQSQPGQVLSNGHPPVPARGRS